MEPLSPVQIEEKLRATLNELTRAEFKLREARDLETDTELAYKRALWRRTLDPRAPEVKRGSAGFTVAEREAWVAMGVEDEWVAYRLAQTGREAAQDHLRTVRDVTEVLRSLGASVRTAYENVGRSER